MRREGEVTMLSGATRPRIGSASAQARRKPAKAGAKPRRRMATRIVAMATGDRGLGTVARLGAEHGRRTPEIAMRDRFGETRRATERGESLRVKADPETDLVVVERGETFSASHAAKESETRQIGRTLGSEGGGRGRRTEDGERRGEGGRG